jgi:hypothetical protein
VAESQPERPGREKNPFLDSDFAGLEIASDPLPESADPYSTNSWRYDRNDEARRSKAKEYGVHIDEPPEDFNPYDTGVFRGAWKD